MVNSELGGTVVLSILVIILVATAFAKGGEAVGPGCLRELWRVLFGGAASLLAMLLCLVQWNPSHLYWQEDMQHGAASSASAGRAPPVSDQYGSVDIDRTSPSSSVSMDEVFSPSSASGPSVNGSNGRVHGFVTVLLETLVPHLNMACIVTTVYAAMTMRQRCRKGRIVKRICPQVLWIGLDAHTYNTHSAVVTRVFRNRRLDKAPNLKMAVPWPAGSVVGANYSKADCYVCSHGWEPRNRMWKEAMVATGVLGQNAEASMEMIERGKPWWAAVLLVMQGVGYQVSVASRLAQGLEVSPVEMMSAWMWLFIVVEAGIMPLVVIPSKRGICLRLDHSQFHQVAQYYHSHESEDITFVNLWCFVVCILFIFFMFLILIPPLVYYYRQLPATILSFASLIPFTVLAGAGIVTFAFTMFLPPQEVLFAFTAHTSKYIFAITLALMLAGLASYVLAIADTCMHWTRFQAADPSCFRFIIPHVGA